MTFFRWSDCHRVRVAPKAKPDMTMPNFLVIGAAKCGTDSLCNYLGQHPEVFISPKREPNFFVAEGQDHIPYHGPGDVIALKEMWTSGLADYQSLFAGVTTEKAVGEGTAWYIYFEDPPRRIRHHIPDAKLIAVLRNPADRAYSAFKMLLRDGREPLVDFAAALDAEQERIRRQWEPIWYYARMGFYSEQLERYYARFDRDQLRVVMYEDFDSNPQPVLRDLFQFLNVDDGFTPDTSRRTNVSLVPRHHRLHHVVAGQYRLKSVVKKFVPQNTLQAVKRPLVDRNMTQPAPMSDEVRGRLIEVFRDDIRKTQDLVGRDLSHWLS
jgi:hypothetical protein